MSTKTTIQWCDTTVNPVMGCDGCELYPGTPQIIAALNSAVDKHTNASTEIASIISAFAARGPQWVKLNIAQIAKDISERCRANSPGLKATRIEGAITEAVVSLYRCYAATLHRFACSKTPKPGWALPFEAPVLVPGRTVNAARLPPRTEEEAEKKPWLKGAPRMIFISDMGDALSAGISFETLEQEIITPAISAEGSRHLWLWLTKRPGRMAQFSRWLEGREKQWPENLVAMTSVTSSKTLGRVSKLLEVPAKYRGLSVEPLWENITLPLAGISWVIVGGESGKNAHPFHTEWAANIAKQCDSAGAAFFLKQLGAKPFMGEKPLRLTDGHGGDWNEWQTELRRRDIPDAWRDRVLTPEKKVSVTPCADGLPSQTGKTMESNQPENPALQTLVSAETRVIAANKAYKAAGKPRITCLLEVSDSVAALRQAYEAIPKTDRPNGGWKEYVRNNAERLDFEFRTSRMADNYIALGRRMKALPSEELSSKLAGCASYRDARERLNNSQEEPAKVAPRKKPFAAEMGKLIKRFEKIGEMAPPEIHPQVRIAGAMLQRLLTGQPSPEKSSDTPSLADLGLPTPWLSLLENAWAQGGPASVDRTLLKLTTECCDDTATERPAALKFGPRTSDLDDEVNRMMTAKRYSDQVRKAFRATKMSALDKTKVAALAAPANATVNSVKPPRKDKGANTMALPLDFA